MSFHPADLVSDVDLLDYEAAILRSFGATSWQGKRTKALEDWLFPILKGQGFDPYRLRTRAAPTGAFSLISGTYTDVSGALSDTTEDDLNLATVFATVGTDALYIGSDQPFRGLFVRMADAVSSTAAVLSVAYFNGNWESLLVSDGTTKTAGKAFSGGGTISWLLPSDWQTRTVNGSDALYWAKVTISATPTSAKTSQIGVVRASSLRAPSCFRTLQLIMAEAPTSQDGPWREKAEFYKQEADQALQRALVICGAEFDTDESDLIDPDEEIQTPAQVSTGWHMERG